jgi:hypothetical protein
VVGSAGDGYEWHHVVEQNSANLARFGTGKIQALENIFRVPYEPHRKISGYYSSIQPFTNGKTVREWLNEQDYEAQRAFGLKTMKAFGVTHE